MTLRGGREGGGAVTWAMEGWGWRAWWEVENWVGGWKVGTEVGMESVRCGDGDYMR